MASVFLQTKYTISTIQQYAVYTLHTAHPNHLLELDKKDLTNNEE